MPLYNYGDIGSRPRYQQKAFVSFVSPFLLKECRDRKHSLYSLIEFRPHRSKLWDKYNCFFLSSLHMHFSKHREDAVTLRDRRLLKEQGHRTALTAFLASPLGSPPFERAAGGKTWAEQSASQRAAHREVQHPSPFADSVCAFLSPGLLCSGCCRGGAIHLNAYQ